MRWGRLVTLLAVGFLGCRSPTEIDLTITTDLPCDGVTSTDLQLGTAGAAGSTSTSTRCDAEGNGNNYLGKLVILPDPGQSPVEILVVTGVHQAADACLDGGTPGGDGGDAGAGCIVERRTWSFSSHEAISGTILMPSACENVACGAGTTCTPTTGGSAACLPIPACSAGGCSSVDASLDGPGPSDSGPIGDARDSASNDSAHVDAPLDSASSGDSTLGDAHVEAALPAFVVGGTVMGLALGDAGSPLVLQDNGGDNLTLTADGTFMFATPISVGASYDVTVLDQPQDPSETCSVTGGMGTVGDAAVSNVGVTCMTNSFAVGGMVTGLELDAGNVTLQNGAGSSVTIGTNGPFNTPSPVLSGQAYAITVVTQPPGQTCLVSNGTGIVGNANVTTVMVTCMNADLAAVSGTLTGLAVGDTVTLLDNGGADAGGDSLTLMGDGPFTFVMPVMNGSTYSVTLPSNPTGPVAQTCTVVGGSGTAASDAGLTGVSVICMTTSFNLGGTIGGLASPGSIDLSSGVAVVGSSFFSTNGSYAFAMQVMSGTMYDVTILGQPTQVNEVCTVANATGVVGAADVTNVTITCGEQIIADVYATGGMLVNVQLDGFQPISTTANGVATAAPVMFPEPIPGGMGFTVTGSSSGLTCTTTPSSPIAGSNNTVTVRCM